MEMHYSAPKYFRCYDFLVLFNAPLIPRSRGLVTLLSRFYLGKTELSFQLAIVNVNSPTLNQHGNNNVALTWKS